MKAFAASPTGRSFCARYTRVKPSVGNHDAGCGPAYWFAGAIVGHTIGCTWSMPPTFVTVLEAPRQPSLKGIAGINMGMTLGIKVLLRNCEVRRGVVLLEPGGVQILGGKIEALDKIWKEGRKERLISAANAGRENAAG